ncbi:hypothetical protein Pan97_48530 [Bremerella volcania]|uniref:DUF5063 domain-containing protein n=1 Tax=Bremerella volcania TaxID=2527984 RepID=A0A518CF22_9BACT|nr:DUF5063 domain-containing protein [Bremerella volcania]QDU77774.1 hypothetical protein Pan97_48530 [Bremerella volcania]
MLEPIDEFVETATQFCHLVEDHESEPLDRFIRKLQQFLPLMYYQAVKLPDVGSRSEPSYQREITHDQWQSLFGRLVQYLGVHDQYWIVHDVDLVADDVPEAILSSLADDVTDIWRDLKNGLLYWEAADEPLRRELIWQWRFHFYGHWSDHVIDAMRAVNRMCQEFEHDED